MNKLQQALLAATVLLTACSTTAEFRLPPDSQVRFDSREQTFPAGEVKTRPYFWNSAGGIPYRVEKDQKLVQEGRLPARFRPVSIFWPPYALIYWPMGFASKCYDLTSGKPDLCVPAAKAPAQTP